MKEIVEREAILERGGDDLLLRNINHGKQFIGAKNVERETREGERGRLPPCSVPLALTNINIKTPPPDQGPPLMVLALLTLPCIWDISRNQNITNHE